MMWRLNTLILAALIIAAPTTVIAKGGHDRLVESMPIKTELPTPSAVELPPSQFMGCGSKRYRDPVTHKCRGPADVGN
jgi:hypothetical protein